MLCFKYSGDLKSDHSKSGLFEGQIPNGRALAMALAIVLNIQNPFLSVFQMVFDKMAAICHNFKKSSFWISDPIQNPDHLQLLYWLNYWHTLISKDMSESGFQIPTVSISHASLIDNFYF